MDECLQLFIASERLTFRICLRSSSLWNMGIFSDSGVVYIPLDLLNFNCSFGKGNSRLGHMYHEF